MVEYLSTSLKWNNKKYRIGWWLSTWVSALYDRSKSSDRQGCGWRGSTSEDPYPRTTSIHLIGIALHGSNRLQHFDFGSDIEQSTATTCSIRFSRTAFPLFALGNTGAALILTTLRNHKSELNAVKTMWLSRWPGKTSIDHQVDEFECSMVICEKQLVNAAL